MTVLLNSLSSWEGTRGGLTLEINAHSPSDQIFHRSEGEVHDDYPIRFKEDLKDLRSFLEYLRDRRAARVTSSAVPRSVRRGAARRLRGTLLELLPQRQKRGTGSTNNLPRVPIVKGLVLCRSFFRGIAPESIATLLRESFVALESFYLHKWIGQTVKKELELFDGTSWPGDFLFWLRKEDSGGLTSEARSTNLPDANTPPYRQALLLRPELEVGLVQVRIRPQETRGSSAAYGNIMPSLYRVLSSFGVRLLQVPMATCMTRRIKSRSCSTSPSGHSIFVPAEDRIL
jgi:hypothetical protein